MEHYLTYYNVVCYVFWVMLGKKLHTLQLKKREFYTCLIANPHITIFFYSICNINHENDLRGAVYRQIIGIHIGTNCATVGVFLLLYWYERDFMLDTQ